MAATSNDQAIAQAWILQAVQKLGYSNIKPEQLVEFCRGTTCAFYFAYRFRKSLCYACLPVAFDAINKQKCGHVAMVTPSHDSLEFDQIQ